MSAPDKAACARAKERIAEDLSAPQVRRSAAGIADGLADLALIERLGALKEQERLGKWIQHRNRGPGYPSLCVCGLTAALNEEGT